MNARCERLKLMKAIFCVVILVLVAPAVRAQQTNLTELLQQGMFEEQANRNLDAAIADYEALSTQFDKDRQLAATAIFRLGECYREEGQTNQAALEYRRILNEFPDQKTLAMLSRQDLAGMGAASSVAGETTGNPGVPAGNSSAEIWNKVKNLRQGELEKVLPTLVPDAILTSLLQQRNSAEVTLAEKQSRFGNDNPEVTAQQAIIETIHMQISQRISGIMEALKLQSEANQPAETAGSGTGVPAGDEDQEIANLQAMIQNSPDLINADPPPLIEAAYSDHLRVAQFLLDHNADVNIEYAGSTPLTRAAGSGHKAMVELLLSHGANINAKDNSGNTALHSAAGSGFQAVTESLLAAHADVNAQNNWGETPLFLAAKNGKADIVKILLSAGANPNIKSGDGKFVLDYAATVSPDMVKMLLAAGADASATNNYGWTPLSNAAEYGNPEIVKILLAAKVDPNGGTVDPPLLCAISKQDTTSAELLLQAGADPNLKGLTDGRLRNVDQYATPLWAAVSLNQLPMVQLLLKYKADPNSSQVNNTPVIFRAVDKTNVLQALLDAGANPNVTDNSGRTPLFYAAEEHSPEAVTILLAAKADPNGGTFGTPLTAAVSIRDPVAMKLLLQAGADPNEKNTFDRSPTAPPLIFSALPDTNVLATLLDFHANPNVWNADGWTPLMSVIDSDNNAEKAVKVAVLLKHGADPNLSHKEFKALHLAAYRFDEDTVRLLLDYGADPNVRNGSGQTPLRIAEDIASGTGNPTEQQMTIAASMAELLRQHGALEVLPDWDHITVSRPSTKFSKTIFYKGTNDWSQFSLYDLLGVQYKLLTTGSPTISAWAYTANSFPVKNDLQFPDFSHVVIHRPSVHGTNWTELKNDLTPALDSGDCSADVPLKFGDVVEIPETDHGLNDQWMGLSTNQLLTLSHCLTRHLQITVNGVTTNIIVKPQMTSNPIAGVTWPSQHISWNVEPQQQLMLWPVLDDTGLLLSSSDLSRVTVKRRDVVTGKTHKWTVDCSDFQKEPGFWLRDGDEIDVPEANGQ